MPVLAETSGDIGYYPAGHPALRRAIAERYTRRGIRTGPERVLITAGARQALSLLARALLAPSDRVLVEGPTYPGALEAFREFAAVPQALPAGLDGLAGLLAVHHLGGNVPASGHQSRGLLLTWLAVSADHRCFLRLT